MSNVEAKYVDVVEDHKAVSADVRLKEAEEDYEDVVDNYGKVLNRHRLSGLNMFKDGVSGNPGGRPKTKLISQAYRKVLQEIDPNDPEGRTFAEMIARGMVREACGDPRAAKEIRETTEGKLPNVVRFEGEISVQHILSEATEEECDELIQYYLEKRYGMPVAGTVIEAEVAE